MILYFDIELGYKDLIDAFILSNNLLSTLVNPEIIDKKLQKDLILHQIIEVSTS